MPIVSTVCALSMLANTSACIENDRLHEFKSIVDCVTLVVKFEAQRNAVNSVCGALFNGQDFAREREFLLCMRNDVAKAGNSQQARKAVEGCAKDFPGERSALIASNFLINTFPTAEQQQINQLKEAQREADFARRTREIDQEYKDRMAKIDRDFAERRRESEARMREIDAASRANRPISCSISGSTVNCY